MQVVLVLDGGEEPTTQEMADADLVLKVNGYEGEVLKARDAVTSEATVTVNRGVRGEVAGPRARTMTKDEFIATLTELTEWVKADDSMEGSLAYEWGDQAGEYLVSGALRFGNQMGQGSLRLLTLPAEDVGDGAS